jgi:hypothetical protein
MTPVRDGTRWLSLLREKPLDSPLLGEERRRLVE